MSKNVPLLAAAEDIWALISLRDSALGVERKLKRPLRGG
jgi:hypothetical protein